MFKGVRLEELDVVAFDGYQSYPFVGDSTHLREEDTQ
jgi:hypothetical protein